MHKQSVKKAVGRPRKNNKEQKVRVLFSISPDCWELFRNYYQNVNRSKLIETAMHVLIGAAIRRETQDA